jgi:hypothetical protein
MAKDDHPVIHNPHDRLFKDTFAHKASLLSFVRAYVPADIAALVAGSTAAEPWPISFVDPEFAMSHSDVIYKFMLNGRPAFLYLLFEHQSTPEPDMAFRLLKYLTRLWDLIEQQQKKPKSKLRPPILPLVLYHGSDKWPASLQFQDLIDVPPAMVPFTPGFEYVLVDLNQPGMQDRVDDLRCRFVLHLLHAAATDRLIEVFRHHGHILTALWRAHTRGDSLRFLEMVIRYVVSVGDIDARELKRIVVDLVDQEAGEIVMTTTAERWMAEGEAKVLQRQLGRKFPDARPVNLDGLSPAQLEVIAERILTCDTLEEVLAGIASG